MSIPVLVFRLVYCVFGLAIVFGVGYFFAYRFLTAVYGTDTIHALSLVVWVDKYFPVKQEIPTRASV